MPHQVFTTHPRFLQGSLTFLLFAGPGLQAHAQAPVSLGQASSFGVLAGSTVTNTGPSVVYGNVGVSPGSAITGFPPGSIVNGALHANDALAQQAHNDLVTAYNVLSSEAHTSTLTGQDLGGLTLTPGVYFFASSAQLTGQLTLNALGDPNARFDFQIGSTLTTASNSNVVLLNSAGVDNVFWQVGSSATLGTHTAFAGNLLALESITFTTGATDLGGRALARNGAVTLDSNILGANTPEPSVSAFLICLGLTSGFALRRRRTRCH